MRSGRRLFLTVAAILLSLRVSGGSAELTRVPVGPEPIRGNRGLAVTPRVVDVAALASGIGALAGAQIPRSGRSDVGAGNGGRTRDIHLGKVALYH